MNECVPISYIIIHMYLSYTIKNIYIYYKLTENFRIQFVLTNLFFYQLMIIFLDKNISSTSYFVLLMEPVKLDSMAS